jgi:hypothetical protein
MEIKEAAETVILLAERYRDGEGKSQCGRRDQEAIKMLKEFVSVFADPWEQGISRQKGETKHVADNL